MISHYDILEGMPTGQLIVARDLVAEAIKNLAGPIILVRKKEVFGIYIGTEPDDPGTLELRAFKAMRNALDRQIDKHVKQGPIISKFVKDGVKIVEGEMVVIPGELKKLNKSLSKVLGPGVAVQVVNDIEEIIEKQWLATKKVVAKSVKEFNRSVKAGLTKADRATIKVLNNQNNFFISGTYDKVMIDRVNKVVADNVKKGLPRRVLDKTLRNELAKDLPPRGDAYYRILANDVVNRARTFSEINSFVEARIRRYEIIAVLDERTTEQCQSMDGRVFETEVARKIVRDITKFGVPTSAAKVDRFKSLRPWVFFDSGRAGAGKNALYYLGPKGEKNWVPDTTFRGTPGNFQSTGKKTLGTSREIQEAVPRNANPPILPPYHGHCRTSTIIDEVSIREDEEQTTQTE